MLLHVRRLLRALFRRRAMEREMQDEMTVHLERATERLQGRGMEPKAARASALREFGNVADVQEVSRDSWGMRWLHDAVQDLRYGARLLRKSPGFTVAGVAVLALGIGANTAIFSFIDALLLRRPPHVAAPEQLFGVYTSDRSGPLYRNSSYPDYLDFAGGLASAADLAAYSQRPGTLGTGAQAEVVQISYVTPNFFPLLRVPAAAGHLFAPTYANASSAEPSAVLSHELWQRAFGGSADALGQSIRLDGQVLTVVGVAPAGFAGPGGRGPADAYVPIGVLRGNIFTERRSRGLSIVGRLAAGATSAEVAARLTAIGATLFKEYPRAWADVRDAPRRVSVVAGRDSWLSPGDSTRMAGFAGLLMGLMGLVLLIACANVANLLLVRATRRRQEIAVRLALGAGRGRLVRQLVTESSLLAGAGGVAGVFLALSTTSLFRRIGDALPINAVLDVRLDARVLLFAFAISLASAAAFALIPALRSGIGSPAAAPKNEPATAGGQGNMLRAGLIAGQVAICLVLLLCAALLLKSLRNAVETQLGFVASGVLLVPLATSPPGYTPETAGAFYRTALERVGSLPGVEDVALGAQVPFSDRYERRPIAPEGYQPGSDEDMEIDCNVVSAGWLTLMRVALVRGRAFSASFSDAAREVVVNQAFAERFWPGEDPIGKRVRIPGVAAGGPVEVVGVTATGKLRALDEAPRPNVYIPLPAASTGNLTLYVRASRDPAALASSVRTALRAIDPAMATVGVRTLESALARQVLPLRMAGTLFTGFGLVALTIAMIGLYGMLAYTVEQRRREIGIRMALGASAASVAAAIVRRGVMLVGIGAGVGLLGAPLATRPLTGILFGVTPTDRLGIAVAIGLLGVVSLLATLIPARRATRVDPMAALRDST